MSKPFYQSSPKQKVTFVKKMYKKFDGKSDYVEIIPGSYINNPNIVRLPDCIVPGYRFIS